MNCCIVKSPRHHSPAVSQFFLDMLLIWCTAFCRLCIVWLQWDGAFSFRRAFDWTKISVVKDESSIFKCIFLLKVNLSPFSLNCLISKLTRIDKSSHFDFFDIMVLCELQVDTQSMSLNEQNVFNHFEYNHNSHVVFLHTNCLVSFSSIPAVNNSFQPQEIRCDLEEWLMPLFFKTLSMLFG